MKAFWKAYSMNSGIWKKFKWKPYSMYQLPYVRDTLLLLGSINGKNNFIKMCNGEFRVAIRPAPCLTVFYANISSISKTGTGFLDYLGYPRVFK